jgi:hypothetical protein
MIFYEHELRPNHPTTFSYPGGQWATLYTVHVAAKNCGLWAHGGGRETRGTSAKRDGGAFLRLEERAECADGRREAERGGPSYERVG